MVSQGFPNDLPSGKRLHNYGKSPFLMGKSTISMAIFNSYVKLPEGMTFVPPKNDPRISQDIFKGSRRWNLGKDPAFATRLDLGIIQAEVLPR